MRGQILRPGESLYVARLTGAEEVPPVSSTATGQAQVALSHDRLRIRYAADTTATPTGAHFHTAMAGVVGGVTVGVAMPSRSMDGEAAVTSAQAADLADNQLWYFNVHTSANPGGELRGQLLRSGDELFVARLTGGQEVPPVAGDSASNGVAVLRAPTNQVLARLVTTLTPTAAHIHTGRGGVNGSVTVPFATTGATMTATATATPAIFADMRAGRLYFNIHTSANPTGQHRGQILRPGEMLFTAQLEGAQEVPPVTTTASGSFAAIVNADGTSLRYEGAYAGVTATAMHFHRAAAGSNGTVIYAISPTASPLSGTQTLTAGDLTDLLASRVYVNLHSVANPGGELRGQLLRR